MPPVWYAVSTVLASQVLSDPTATVLELMGYRTAVGPLLQGDPDIVSMVPADVKPDQPP